MVAARCHPPSAHIDRRPSLAGLGADHETSSQRTEAAWPLDFSFVDGLREDATMRAATVRLPLVKTKMRHAP
jgi:hypothetical protein